MFDFLKRKKKETKPSREEIGDENLQRLAEAIRKMDDPNYQSEGKRAQEQIKQMKEGHVADNLKIILKEDK